MSARERLPRRCIRLRRRAAPRRAWRPVPSVWKTCSRPRSEICRISTSPSATMKRPRQGSPSSKRASPVPRLRAVHRAARRLNSVTGREAKYGTRLRVSVLGPRLRALGLRFRGRGSPGHLCHAYVPQGNAGAASRDHTRSSAASPRCESSLAMVDASVPRPWSPARPSSRGDLRLETDGCAER